MNREKPARDQQLRIQLEGQLEVVEAWVARVLEAARTLSGPAWQADHRWHFLGDSNHAAEGAVGAVRRKLEEEQDPGAGATLRDLSRVSEDIDRVARRQLLELGIEPEQGTSTRELVLLLRAEVPYTATRYFHDFYETPINRLGVLMCFVLGALLVPALVIASKGRWTIEVFGMMLFSFFFFGLLLIVIRMLGGWAMELVPRSTWRLVMSPRSIRTRVGGQWWAAEWSQIKSAQVRHVKPMWEVLVQCPTPRRLLFRSRPRALIAELARRGIGPSEPG